MKEGPVNLESSQRPFVQHVPKGIRVRSCSCEWRTTIHDSSCDTHVLTKIMEHAPKTFLQIIEGAKPGSAEMEAIQHFLDDTSKYPTWYSSGLTQFIMLVGKLECFVPKNHFGFCNIRHPITSDFGIQIFDVLAARFNLEPHTENYYECTPLSIAEDVLAQRRQFKTARTLNAKFMTHVQMYFT